jgi:hypothetical protein
MQGYGTWDMPPGTWSDDSSHDKWGQLASVDPRSQEAFIFDEGCPHLSREGLAIPGRG